MRNYWFVFLLSSSVAHFFNLSHETTNVSARDLPRSAPVFRPLFKGAFALDLYVNQLSIQVTVF